MPHWTRCCCPVSSNVEEIKNTPFFKFFKCFSPRLERQPGLNVSLRASSLGARDSTRDSAKGIRNPASSPGRLWGRGTAPRILLKESGITVALRGCLGAGTAGFSYRNPQSRELPGGLQERGTAPGIQLQEYGITLALGGGGGALWTGDSTRDAAKGIWNPSSSLRDSGGGGQEQSPPESFLAGQLNVFHHD